MNTLTNNFREAGRNNLTWQNAVDEIAPELRDDTDPEAYDAASAAYDAGQRDRARAAIGRFVASMCEPADPFAEHVCEPVIPRDYYNVDLIDVSRLREDKLEEWEASALLELLAEVTWLQPSEMVEVVAEFCQMPCDASRLAEFAWAEFYGCRWRARLKDNEAEYSDIAELLAEVTIDQEPPANMLARFVHEWRQRTDFDPDWRQRHELDRLTAVAVEMALLQARDSLHLQSTDAPATGGLAYVDFDPDLETPPPAWLAKGLLPRAGIGVLLGESGAGKSFAAIHAALSVAWGLPLFGAKVSQGAVLYIAAEGGKSVARRFTAANRERGGAVTAANLTRSDGAPVLARAPIRIVHEAPDLSREGDATPLVETIRNARAEFERLGHRLALVIVDTWHAAMGGGEENSAADAGHALKPLVAESEAGDFLTLIVHHPGKDSERGARGSNALPAAADAIISVTVPGHEGAKAKPSTALRRAVVTKMRDGEAGGEFAYRLPVVEIGVDADGEPVTTCHVQPCDVPTEQAVGKLSGYDRKLMECVATVTPADGEGRASYNAARSAFYNRLKGENPDQSQDTRRKAWDRARDKALAEGRLAMNSDETQLWTPKDQALTRTTDTP